MSTGALREPSGGPGGRDPGGCWFFLPILPGWGKAHSEFGIVERASARSCCLTLIAGTVGRSQEDTTRAGGARTARAAAQQALRTDPIGKRLSKMSASALYRLSNRPLRKFRPAATAPRVHLSLDPRRGEERTYKPQQMRQITLTKRPGGRQLVGSEYRR